MAGVTYDERSFLVAGGRIWLVSGSLHYFRVPSALWPDRLMKAKRAGLNCISTYIPWNFHEPAEGQWDLSGDHDVSAFVKLAQKLGLYVILRPGPYICGQWDFGGLPAWLTTKTGMAFRTSNAAYTHYFDKYFRQVLVGLADLQVTRGGNIILIQNENEYAAAAVPERLNYLEFISQLFRRSGFDIPIITSNFPSDPLLPQAVDCLSVEADVPARLKRMRLRQPGAPLLVTEFSGGSLDVWGSKHHAQSPRQVARRALEILGCGAQYNYYMFHGGTNFVFWPGRMEQHEAAYQTTSYDCDAPLAEGGGLTQKYYFTRLVNLLANHMGRFFARCRSGRPGLSVHDSTDVLNIYGPAGQWAIVTNNGREEIKTAEVSLPTGKRMEVSLEAIGATAVPINLELTSNQTLDYTNLMPMGFFAGRILVLHGPAGWQGLVSVNGKELALEVPHGKEPVVVEHQDLQLVVLNTELAMRTWPLEEAIIFGPRFVGQDAEDIDLRRGVRQYAVLSLEGGNLFHKKVKQPQARVTTKPPRLATWKRIHVCPEPASENLEWQKIDRPRGVDHLGVHYGYVWYRIEINQDRARKHNLFLPQFEDRATIYLNGQFLGTWGRGAAAGRRPIPAAFKRGKNVLAVLADNLGRNSSGTRLGELKGFHGHVYDARLLRPPKGKLKLAGPLSHRIVPRAMAYRLGQLEAQPIWQADFAIPLTRVTPIHLSFEGLGHHAAVLCNDKPAGLFVAHGLNYGDVTFGTALRRGKNVIRVLLWGDVSPHATEALRFYSLAENLTEKAAWSFRPWGPPAGSGLSTGKQRPAWHACRFKYAGMPTPLFLQIFGAQKGQLFLNGHNLGRFWTVGPQGYYYLPECWLAAENELLVFEEQGRSPTRSKLVHRPLGPYQE